MLNDLDDLRIIPTIGMTPHRARIVEAGNEKIRRVIADKPEQERRIFARTEEERRRNAAYVARSLQLRREYEEQLLIKKMVMFKPRQIILEVAKKYDVLVKDVIGTRRKDGANLARQEAMYRMRNETSLSYPEIGRRIGGRDHTTIMFGVKAHERRMREGQEDPCKAGSSSD